MKKKRTLLAGLVALGVILAMTIPAIAGPVGTASGFEDDDGNLAPGDVIETGQPSPNFDWNSFAATTWTGTAPTRTSSKTVSGWAFTGLEDAQATTSDSAFAGGTKQDNDCATVIGAKAPNKDDLKRVYVTSKTVGGDVFLNLAWVRIPQNTTSPSAHIGFEFNQGSTACPAGSDGLVRRTAGDMLIVYDFEGGTTDVPTLTLRRWITSGSCEVSSNSPPCWGTSTNLTAQGFAEGKVNTLGSVSDTIGPSSPASETLGTNEFGEAGINLTDAGVFPPNACVAFGKTYAVSRSSGNSATAQMKDLVGPGNINITNCGTITIIKQTDPRGVNQNFNYSTTGGLTPSTFTLNDTGNAGKTLGSTDPAQNSAGNTRTYTNVFAGSYSVTEGADPAGFVFDSLTCTATGTGTSVTTSSKTANITLAGGGAVTCLYVNEQQLGAIQVTKTRKHAADGPGSHPHAGVSFTVNGVTKQTDANGIACFDGLSFGAYNVSETVPAGYDADGATTKSVTVDNNATCTDVPYGGETVSFSNTPLTDITVSVNSQVDGGTASTIECVDDTTPPTTVASGSTDANGDGSQRASDLQPGTYTCTIVIDP